MVSVLTPRKVVGFNIDSLLGGQDVDVINSDSDTSYQRSMERVFTRDGFFPSLNNQTNLNQRSGEMDLCSSCCDIPTSHDNLLSTVRPYDMTNSNINTRNFIRNAGLTPHSWSLLDSVSHVQQSPHSDIHRNSFGNFGLKFQNSLVQFDSISGGYSPFSGLFSPVNGTAPSQVPPRGDPGTSYTWATSRGGGYLTPRVSVNPDAGLFMTPYRKPKRVRTAFSPTQLLRLEHAFEKNHYVVGQERKDLASSLSLSETQVKVWFQNRRTKHKRMKAEEEMTSSLTQRMQDRERADSPIFDDI